jgi:small subunit ribosomal protein S21
MQVLVRDNNVEQALRVLKKKLQREGVFREMKRARFYEKPSEKATREKSEAISSRSQAGSETSYS